MVLQDTKTIRDEAVKVFEHQFTESIFNEDFSVLNCIPKIITEERRKEMDGTPTSTEVKEVVFSLNSESPCGLMVYQEVISKVVGRSLRKTVKIVIAFFCGYELPRHITLTSLVLIPKKEKVTKFIDLRPISLSTFSNKVISKIIHNRLDRQGLLPTITSRNQPGCIKGRSIAKNVLLAQEIIRDINRRNKLHNIVVKLDMVKAYVRIFWIFLTKVIRRFEFSEDDRYGVEADL